MTGGCLCGGVRFEISEPPISASYCHCKHCQRRTGSAASAHARIDPGSLRILKGGELLRSYIPPGGWAKVFCSVCGSGLFSHPPNQSEISSVRLGSFDGDVTCAGELLAICATFVKASVPPNVIVKGPP